MAAVHSEARDNRRGMVITGIYSDWACLNIWLTSEGRDFQVWLNDEYVAEYSGAMYGLIKGKVLALGVGRGRATVRYDSIITGPPDRSIERLSVVVVDGMVQ